MEHIGYSLINLRSKKEIQRWGDTPGQCPGIPDVIRLPNGDMVHAPQIDGKYDGFQLVKRWGD